jgi:hypothetical protein
MRQTLTVVVSVLSLCFAWGLCSAQVFGNYATARTVQAGKRVGGAYFTIADDVLGLLGQFRCGYSDDADFGVQLGFNSTDSRVYRGGMFTEEGETHLLLGGDGKYNLRKADEGMPVDVSVDFGAGYVDMEESSRLLFSLSGQGGWTVETENAKTLSPYVGLGVIVDRVSIDTASGNLTDTDTDIEVRLGAAYLFSSGVSAIAELQTGDGTSFGVGLNVRF